jgi:LysR family transcriptional regulator (chromosome initiation inhibitor)
MLDARQLDALVAVVEHGSFGVAAKALSITLVSLHQIAGRRDGPATAGAGKQVRATPAGSRWGSARFGLMEADLVSGFAGSGRAQQMQTLGVAVNGFADQLVLPGHMLAKTPRARRGDRRPGPHP